MTLAGRSTADIGAYDDSLCNDTELLRLLDRMQVVGDEDLARGTSEVVVTMADGVVYREFDNRSVPNSNLDEQGRRLEEKFHTLAAPLIGEQNADAVVEQVARLDDLDSVDDLLGKCQWGRADR